MLSLQLFRVEPTLGWGREQGFASSVYSSSIGSVCACVCVGRCPLLPTPVEDLVLKEGTHQSEPLAEMSFLACRQVV